MKEISSDLYLLWISPHNHLSAIFKSRMTPHLNDITANESVLWKLLDPLNINEVEDDDTAFFELVTTLSSDAKYVAKRLNPAFETRYYFKEEPAKLPLYLITQVFRRMRVISEVTSTCDSHQAISYFTPIPNITTRLPLSRKAIPTSHVITSVILSHNLRVYKERVAYRNK